jgi:hypothetical protein
VAPESDDVGAPARIGQIPARGIRRTPGRRDALRIGTGLKVGCPTLTSGRKTRKAGIVA